MRRVLRIAAIVLFGLIAAVLVSGLILLRTDFAKERVRRLIVSALGNRIDGTIRIGAVRGGLLSDLTLIDVEIKDSDGNPFVAADTIRANYDILQLYRRNIVLRDVRLVKPSVFLDQKTGERWNYARIFRLGEDTAQTETTRPVTHLRLDRVRLVGANISLRTSWQPDSGLTGAERARAVSFALSDSNLLRVERANGSYQMVQEYQRLHARLPTIRIIDPEESTILVGVDSLAGLVRIFRGEGVPVAQASGRVEIAQDSLSFENMDVRLPASALRAEGSYRFESGGIVALVHVDSVTGSDVQWLNDEIPRALKGRFRMNMEVEPDKSRYRIAGLALRLERATATGELDVSFGEKGFREGVVDANLSVNDLEARLIRDVFPRLNLPVDGVFHGSASLDGNLQRALTHADITFHDRLSGRSHFVAAGNLALADEVTLRDMRVRLQPVQVQLVRNFAPEFPLRGTVTGSVLLNGTPGRRITSTLDVEHSVDGHLSRLRGTAAVSGTANPILDVDVVAEPLDLAAMRAFAPESKIRGDLRGPVSLSGPLSALEIDARLTAPDSGVVTAHAVIDLHSDTLDYSAAVGVARFNVASVLETTSSTSINGNATAAGRGTDPGSLIASFTFELKESLFRDVLVDSVSATAGISRGVLTVDTMTAHAMGAYGSAKGALGLTDSTRGSIGIHVIADSLSSFRRWIPGDTTIVRPSASRIAEAYRLAREDSARRARATEVQRLISGEPPPRLDLSLPPEVRADSVAGRATFEGSLMGNIGRLSAEGELTASGVVASGMTIDTARVNLHAVLLPGDSLDVTAVATIFDATAAGLAVDSVFGAISWRGEAANFQVEVIQGTDELYEARFDLTVNQDSTVIDLTHVSLRFDSVTTWRSRHRGRLSFARNAITIDSLSLDAGQVGSIEVDGKIAEGGDGVLDIDVYGVQIAHVLRALQTDLDMSGLLTVTGTMRGSIDAPTFKGSAGFVEGAIGRNPLPELHAVFDYAPGTMKAEFFASRTLGETFLVGNAEVPLNLGRGQGPLVPDRSMMVDMTFEEVPLELLPDVTENVSNIRGSMHGELHVTGTLDDPRVTGNVAITGGSARINLLGVQLTRLAAHVVMDGSTIRIDSVTALSGSASSTVRLEGSLGVEKLSEPSFDLTLNARNAYVLNNENGRLRANLYDITMKGPFTGATIEGSARILNGVVYVPDIARPSVLAPEDSLFRIVMDTAEMISQELYEPPSPLVNNLTVNVTIEVAHDTWVRSSEANVELFSEGPMNIFMNRASNQLVMRGVLGTERGQYTWLGKRFEVKRGSATFIGDEEEINPTLQIVGDYEVQIPSRGTTRISVIVGGTMREPKVSLESDAQPPLSQSDMLSYLAFGRTSGTLFQLGASALSSGDLLQGAGNFGVQQLFGIGLGALVTDVEGRGVRDLGLDEFNIVPGESYTEIAQGDVGSFLRQTDFEAGKYLTRRTFVAGHLSLAATPGVRVLHRAPKGYRFELSWEPRILLREPTLREQRSITKRAFALFIFREWRW